jgi:hypothetical protein
MTRRLSRTATAAACILASCLIAAGQEPSLGDLAREARKSHASPPVKVYTNEDIPQATNEVIWRSAVMAPPATPAVSEASSETAAPSPIKMRSEDVECSFSFRAQPLIPHGKPEPTRMTELPASEVAKLDGTASIWGETLDVSIHNDTGWLRPAIRCLTCGSRLSPTPPRSPANRWRRISTARIGRGRSCRPKAFRPSNCSRDRAYCTAPPCCTLSRRFPAAHRIERSRYAPIHAR